MWYETVPESTTSLCRRYCSNGKKCGDRNSLDFRNLPLQICDLCTKACPQVTTSVPSSFPHGNDMCWNCAGCQKRVSDIQRENHGTDYDTDYDTDDEYDELLIGETVIRGQDWDPDDDSHTGSEGEGVVTSFGQGEFVNYIYVQWFDDPDAEVQAYRHGFVDGENIYEIKAKHFVYTR